MCGTLAYVAPEVFGDGYDERCDTWSLGCTIFVACTNVQPFVGETDRDVVKAVVKGKPDFDMPNWQKHPEELINIVKQMMVREPNAREAPKKLIKDCAFMKDFEPTQSAMLSTKSFMS